MMEGTYSTLVAYWATLQRFTGYATADSLADIDHVVLFMQENRAFDHYFGTMAGVRGFSDPNAQINGYTPVWEQVVDQTLSPNATFLTPWMINYLGGDWENATQCMIAGDNGWSSNHLAYNEGLNNHWAVNNTPWSWGHFTRDDLPVHYAINDAWTMGDMYQEGVIAATNPNRVTWVSGTVNVSGGSPYIDNWETPGCEATDLDCYPLTWKTMPEAFQDADVSWQVFQDADNFDDNPLAWFQQFVDAKNGSELYSRGFKGLTLDTFYEQAGNGTLPELSFIIGPTQLSEHPPYAPRDGAWLQRQVVEAVVNSPKYSRTALIISFDETGGFGDHVVPYHSPKDTPGEWMVDPWTDLGDVFTGPGFRVPFTIISPWTRGSNVFTEHCDHNSQLLFLEQWQAARGKNIMTPNMEPWRRAHMSNLLNAFDFANPDLSIPDLPEGTTPHTNADGVYDGSSYCEATYPTQRPPVPYDGAEGSAKPGKVYSLSENGFKSVRGSLTEGRYLVFEMNGHALAAPGSSRRRRGASYTVEATQVSDNHDAIAQRWVAHIKEEGGNIFQLSSANDGSYLTSNGKLNSESGDEFTITFVAGQGYAVKAPNGQYVAISRSGRVTLSSSPAYFEVFSVTYNY